MAISVNFKGQKICKPGAYTSIPPTPLHAIPLKSLSDLLYKLKVTDERRFFLNVKSDDPTYGTKRV